MDNNIMLVIHILCLNLLL